MEQVRLDRFLANSGCGTRNEVKKQIRSGGVKVGDLVEKDPRRKILPGTDPVFWNGHPVELPGNCFLMLNKPAGTITATHDRAARTVLDCIDEHRTDLFPVGRLDRDTEGLLIITNDGDLCHRLTSPAWHVEKTYEAVVTGNIHAEHIKAFAEGLDIGDEKLTLPARLEVIGDGHEKLLLMEGCRRVGQEISSDVSFVRVMIREGRYHQVKRMFEAVGEKVIYLKRLRMGPLLLDPSLQPGEYRALSDGEILALQKTAQKEQ